MKHVHFPTDDLELDKGSTLADAQKVREHDAKNLIRLLTRMLFVWFIKQRGLVPHELFDAEAVAREYLDGFSAESKDTRFYKAILQNFFFAALNQEREERGFTKGGRDYMDNMTVMRYEKAFKEPQRFLDTVKETTPFLNGGLFECLDFVKTVPKGEKEVKKKFYEDGFSDRNDNQIEVPDFLFFGKETTDDLRDTWGIPSKGNEPVQGLIHILNRYNFTIVENSPIEQEVALDPELLGKVFENLLASYNPETQTTARKQTGSFYTPRPIVDYMVDESLKAYLLKPLTEEAGMPEDDAKAGLDLLFSYEERDMDTVFEPEQVDVLIRAIDQCKILDLACGSGAFPMGILQKLVFVLSKLDPKNERWEQRQIDEARKIADPDQRRERIREIMDDFEANDDDYGRKLYLTENCLYGVDIQSIATQVSKLRFFISLVVDQNIDPAKDNFGVRPLPNLETKFVAADTLIAAEQPSGQKELAELTDVQRLKDELQDIRHKIFSVKTTTTKQKYKADDEAKRNEIAAALKANGWPDETADRLARWDPYKQNDSADFFDPDWMFGLKGFDVVIGNPPYIQIQKFSEAQKKRWENQNYKTYTPTGDIYFLFYERGFSLMKNGGQLAYIVSNSWLPSITFNSIRSFLTSKFRWDGMLSIQTNLFSAVVDTVVTLLTKNTEGHDNEIPISTFTERGIEFTHLLHSGNIPVDGRPINLITKASKRAPIETIFSSPFRIKDVAAVYNGVKPFEVGKGKPPQTKEIVKTKPYVVENAPRPSGKDWRPLLRGSLIHRYTNYWNGDSWIKYGSWLAAPRKSHIFDSPLKIVVRQTGDSIIATKCDGNFVQRNNLHIVFPNNTERQNLLFLLGVLNSKAIDMAYEFLNPEKGEVLAEVKKKHVEQLPVPKASKEEVNKVASLVDAALRAREADKHANIEKVTEAIDREVFKLFGVKLSHE